MKKQLFYGLLLGAALAGCTSDDYDFEQSKVAQDWATARPMINVEFTAPETSRFTGSETTVGYTTTDKLGAVLVDFDHTNPNSYWVIKDSHVGNNKFVYRDGKFVTDGTMVKGTWVMYSPYSTDMTTTRDGIKFTPNVVQTWAADVSEIAKIDFRVSPACELDGSEAGTFSDAINLQSVYAYTNIQLEFPQSVKVQKLVVKPSTPFAKVYKIKNTNYSAVTAGGYNGVVTANSKNTAPSSPTWSTRMDRAQKAMRLNEAYVATTFATSSANLPLVKDGSATQDIWALDCKNAPEGTTFQGYMAIPEGAYTSIDVYAYTNKGVYKYIVDNDHKATTLASETPGSTLYLRGNMNVSLGRVNSNCPAESKEDKVLPKAQATLKTNAELKTAAETNGTVVISQEDLIDVINGIAENGVAEIRVLQNGDNQAVKITKAVMDALNAKQATYSGAQLKFKDSEIVIEGEATAYQIHDLIFTEGCKLTTGNIEVGGNVKLSAGKKFTIASGASATIVTNGKCANSATENEYQTIVNNGTLNVNNPKTNPTSPADDINLPVVQNKGTITIDGKTKSIIADLTNDANKSVVVTASGNLTVNKLQNNGTMTNNNTLSLDGSGTFVNNGTITNTTGTLGISGVVDNNGTITNAANQTILVSTVTSDGVLNNTAAGKITNYGFMYCHEGVNKINNLGTIYAKANSTTYITTNSEANESSSAINSGIKVGSIVLDNRNEDVSVTTKTQKGYIKWTTNGATLAQQAGDKFNYVILPNNAATTVPSNSYAKYIEVNGGTITLQGTNYGSIEFKAGTTVYANPTTKVKFGKLTVAENVIVKVPTENAIGVYSLLQGNTYFTSSVCAEIQNKGTLLIGGDFYTSLEQPLTGTFASGDGESTAFHWETATW